MIVMIKIALCPLGPANKDLGHRNMAVSRGEEVGCGRFQGQWWVIGSMREPEPRVGGRAQPIGGSLQVGVLVPGLLT